MTSTFLKNKKFLARTVSLLLLFVFLFPVLIYAEGSPTNAGPRLVRCGNAGADGKTVMCTFDDLIALINRIIDWIIGISGTIFAVSLIYGGFLYMTSGDKPGNKEKAINILWNTVKGFVIILVAWLIVQTILKTLATDSAETNSI